MVCKITGIELIKGGVCPTHEHLYVLILPKMSISEVILTAFDYCDCLSMMESIRKNGRELYEGIKSIFQRPKPPFVTEILSDEPVPT